MKKILIIRPDNLGDVVLTLPLAGIIKRHYPNTIVAFLGRRYSEPVIRRSRFIDEFYDWPAMQSNPVEQVRKIGADIAIHVYPDKEIAAAVYRAGVPIRVGTGRRWFNILYCNRRIWLKRRQSNLHEAQLNTKLLAPIGINKNFSLDKLHQYYGWKKSPNTLIKKVLKPDKKNIIFHPKSKGHGCEWPVENYLELANLLPEEKFHILITGTHEEGVLIEKACPKIFHYPHVVNLTGKHDLDTFIALIEQSDCLVASGTGPVHIAAAAGITAIGLYPPVRPIHPGRWGPLGKNANALCRGQLTRDKRELRKISSITPDDVKIIIIKKIKMDSRHD